MSCFSLEENFKQGPIGPHLLSQVTHPVSVWVKGVEIGGRSVTVMAGPCAVETEESLHQIAAFIKQCGAVLLRGGAYKPSSSPYGFQGTGELGLRWLAEVGKQYQLGIVTEVMSIQQLDKVMECADLIQVGTRNMDHYELLKELGRCGKPILLKRGMSARVEEWLLAAEYLMKGGNDQIIFCERGIRTFETYTRNTLDLSSVPAIKELTHFPIIVDPSQGTGRRSLVAPMCYAAVAAGADGLLVEVHPEPELALKDGPQSLNFKEFDTMMQRLRPVVEACDRNILHANIVVS